MNYSKSAIIILIISIISVLSCSIDKPKSPSWITTWRVPISNAEYNIVESMSEYIPLINDKNRLGFGLYKYMKGEGDPPRVLLRSAKIKVSGISIDELADKIDAELKKISAF